MAKKNQPPPDPLTKAKLLAAEIVSQRTGIPLAQAYADLDAKLAQTEREVAAGPDPRLPKMFDTEVKHENRADSSIQTFGAPRVVTRKA